MGFVFSSTTRTTPLCKRNTRTPWGPKTPSAVAIANSSTPCWHSWLYHSWYADVTWYSPITSRHLQWPPKHATLVPILVATGFVFVAETWWWTALHLPSTKAAVCCDGAETWAGLATMRTWLIVDWWIRLVRVLYCTIRWLMSNLYLELDFVHWKLWVPPLLTIMTPRVIREEHWDAFLSAGSDYLNIWLNKIIYSYLSQNCRKCAILTNNPA